MTERNKASDKSKQPVRDNLEAFGIAILMAVLFKFFAIEAYQIPTSSMQPTMMGSTAAGVYDRIIVDKDHYEIHEPERFDIAVFRYPLRIKQNYVKRIVGLPGERLRIAGGNIYQIESGDGLDPTKLKAVQKPGGVQGSMWREIFPARMLVNGDDAMLDYFNHRGGKWEEQNGAFTVALNNNRNQATLTYSRTKDGGLCNNLYDGYSVGIARDIRSESSPMETHNVQDIRFACTVVPEGSGMKLQIEIGVQQVNGKSLRFALEAENGSARLKVIEGSEEKLSSEPFDLEFSSGSPTRIAFAHIDDYCRAWLDGDEIASIETGSFKTLEVLQPSTGGRGTVTARLRLQGIKSAEIIDLVIDRDQHYTTSSRPRSGPRIVEVPEGHYFMMGDNTLQSVDSRDWQQLEVGVIDDDRMVDLNKYPEAKRLRGNLRPVTMSMEPDPDENPVPVMSRERIVFTDHLGEVHVLRGQINLNGDPSKDYGSTGPWFDGGPGGEPWQAEISSVSFVPREHILGRAMVAFWPVYPWRLGFYR